jgi:hypothetical protein
VTPFPEANAAYIAACSPERILALVERVRELEGQVRTATDAVGYEQRRNRALEGVVEAAREADREGLLTIPGQKALANLDELEGE